MDENHQTRFRKALPDKKIQVLDIWEPLQIHYKTQIRMIRTTSENCGMAAIF
jgi:transposase